MRNGVAGAPAWLLALLLADAARALTAPELIDALPPDIDRQRLAAGEIARCMC
jgi:hypothetical protein